MKKPNKLNQGDTIGILSTARKISKKELEFSIKMFESWGLKVVLGKTIGVQDNQFAGNDKLRKNDFQNMLNDENIKAIICARGGYGTVRIVDDLDFTKFMLKPKWIVGYSDVTILHAHINNYLHVETLHATMPINFASNTKESLDSLKKVLFGENIIYNFSSNKMNKFGEAKGEIIGGNLSILYSILGTKSGFNPDNKILFIEDLDEMLYHIDRMILALKRAGKFNKIKALLVGGMSDMRDNTKEYGFSSNNPFGKTAKEIILEHTAEFDFPICFDVPAGHINDNRTLIFGREAKIIVEKNKSEICFK
ncbi:MAG: S66 peptidase family protein [Chitinophagales bacterium]